MRTLVAATLALAFAALPLACTESVPKPLGTASEATPAPTSTSTPELPDASCADASDASCAD